MTTTFQSRKLVRDELVTLFAANGSWQEVYGYFPSAALAAGRTPVLMIRSRGTRQDMAGVWINPASYRFLLSSFVLAYSSSDSWTSANAEDKLDELDKVLRQVIRDNVGSLTYADNLRFEEGFSDVSDIDLGGNPYIVETRAILVDLPSGTSL